MRTWSSHVVVLSHSTGMVLMIRIGWVPRSTMMVIIRSWHHVMLIVVTGVLLMVARPLILIVSYNDKINRS